ncbi:MAG: potassium channel family protein [Planctomycetota bacterium]
MTPTWAERRRFSILLGALALLLTLYPLEEASGRARVVFQVGFDMVLVAAVLTMRRAPRWFLAGLGLEGAAVTGYWSAVLLPGTWFGSRAAEVLVNLATGLGVLLVICFVLRDLFSCARVTGDRLCGALCVYMLLGLLWGFLDTAVELAAPGSFAIGDGLRGFSGNDESLLSRSGELFYYSFITLTTVGFGDVSPTGTEAQMLTMWEALVGQAYLTIMVARLVGLHVSSQR